MDDIAKKVTSNNHLPRETSSTKQTSWLTKNRFWNLVFLFLVPAEIYLAALMWNAWMLILPIATTIAIFNFVPADEGTITPQQARRDAFAKAACGIFFASIIALFFVSSTILPIVAMLFGQFALGGAVFLIFLIPISILCYANIPLSSCIEAKDSSEMKRSRSDMFSHSNEMAHRRLSPSQSWRAENVFHKR
jgi:hypothetical protein